MSGASLTLDRLNKRYNPGTAHEVHAVRDFNLAVTAGEIVALLGSSGCGKTSTLRMIAGFEDVSAGAITLAGRPIHTLQPARRNVAMAFEGYSLYPPLTVGENIAFALKSQRPGAAEVERRVGEIARLLQIEDILGRLSFIDLGRPAATRQPGTSTDTRCGPAPSGRTDGTTGAAAAHPFARTSQALH